MKLHLPSNPFAPQPARAPVPKVVLYRGKGMLLFRFLVRAKVFQVAGFFMVAMLLSMVTSVDRPDPATLSAAAALAVGCIVTSYCVWFYSSRYVGELSLLLPERKALRFSVLDFWGNRQDNDVPLQQLEPPFLNRSVAEVKAMVKPPLMPLAVKGDRQYYISLGHGRVMQEEMLLKILYGKFDGSTEEEGAQQDVTQATSSSSGPAAQVPLSAAAPHGPAGSSSNTAAGAAAAVAVARAGDNSGPAADLIHGTLGGGGKRK